MTLSRVNLVQAVANLNNMTRERQIKWHVCEPTPAGMIPMAEALRQSYSYCAPYQGKTLRITERRTTSLLAEQIGRFSPDSEPSAQSAYSLEIIDDKRQVLYQFPTVQGIADLMQSVRFQLSDVDQVINSLLEGKVG